MGREAFLARVWQRKQKSRGNILGSAEAPRRLLRLGPRGLHHVGRSGRAAGEEGNFHDAVIKVFVDLYDKGLIYRGKRLVNWDPHFETAISDLEVENRSRSTGHMWHFKYPLAGGETYEYVDKDAEGRVTLRETRDYISIATTRPETMLGDGAWRFIHRTTVTRHIVGKLCEIPVGPERAADPDHHRRIPRPRLRLGRGQDHRRA